MPCRAVVSPQRTSYPLPVACWSRKPVPFTSDVTIFRLVMGRYDCTGLVVTSNKGVLDWGKIFNGQVLASIILDPLSHATVLFIKGDSNRLKERRKAS